MGRTDKQHLHDKWVALRTKLLETDITDTGLIHKFADFLCKVSPQPAPQKTPQRHPSTGHSTKIEMVDMAEKPQRSSIAQRPELPSACNAVSSYEVSKSRPSSCSVETETSDFDDDVREVVEVSSPYLNNMRFLDEQYGIRQEGNTLMIGSAAVIADEKGDISIGEVRSKGTRGLWELLTRKNVNSDVITNSDLKAYKRILVLTNAHLAGYEPGGDIQISLGAMYANVIFKLFSQTRRRRPSALQQYWSLFRDSHA